MITAAADPALVEGAVCTPNISAAGKRRRHQIAIGAAVVFVVLLASLMVAHVAWWWRLVVFLPAASAAVSELQVRRNTCVARAREGVVEHDDFSTTPASEKDVAASRKVARGIRRDGLLVGLLAAALGAASALVA